MSYHTNPSATPRCCCSGPPVLRPLRDRCTAQATAVPALRRAVFRQAQSQPGRTQCHWGDGRPLPCAVRVGGAAGGTRRALGAVPAGAHPVPRRCCAPLRQDRARSGRRSVPRNAPQRRDGIGHAPLRAHRARLNGSASPSHPLSPRPCCAVHVRAGAVQPLGQCHRERRHEGRCAGRARACVLLRSVPTTKGTLCWRVAVARRAVGLSGRAVARGARVCAAAGGVPAELRGVGGAGRAGCAHARVPARGGGVRGGPRCGLPLQRRAGARPCAAKWPLCVTSLRPCVPTTLRSATTTRP